jgi:hypothetical protein
MTSVRMNVGSIKSCGWGGGGGGGFGWIFSDFWDEQGDLMDVCTRNDGFTPGSWERERERERPLWTFNFIQLNVHKWTHLIKFVGFSYLGSDNHLNIQHIYIML